MKWRASKCELRCYAQIRHLWIIYLLRYVAVRTFLKYITFLLYILRCSASLHSSSSVPPVFLIIVPVYPKIWSFISKAIQSPGSYCWCSFVHQWFTHWCQIKDIFYLSHLTRVFSYFILFTFKYKTIKKLECFINVMNRNMSVLMQRYE